MATHVALVRRSFAIPGPGCALGRNLLSVVDALYEGVLDDQAWSAALARVADVVSGTGTLFFSCNPSTGEVYRYDLAGLDEAAMQTYQSNWIAQDVRYGPGLVRPVGEPQTESTLVLRRDFRRSAIYNDFLVPNDVPHFLAAWVIRSPTHGVAISVQGSRRRGPFDDEDRQTIATLIPHVRRVVDIKDRLTRTTVRADALLQSMDRLPFGVIVLAEDMTILEASKSASKNLASCDGLHVIDGRLGFRRAADARAFAQALTQDLAGPRQRDGVVTMEKASRRDPLTLLVTPLAPGHQGWLRPGARYLVLVFEPDQVAQPSGPVLQIALGLTAAEADLAGLLAAGLSLAEAAERKQLSIHTVRTQLKSIYGKTGVTTQSRLIRLILTGPGAVSAGKVAR